jgi:hypothetical protein
MEAGRAERWVTFAGVDEAGFGPLLGPLTIGFSVFRSPAQSRNLWKSLETVVAADLAGERRRFVVADSKVVFTRTPPGERRLESTALGFLSLLASDRRPPRNGLELAWERPSELACPREVCALHPWYRHLEADVPRHQELGSLEIRVEKLARAMRTRSIELVDAGVRVTPEAELNRSFRETDNKSLTLWRQCAPILRRLWDRHALEGLHVHVDRHGGRYYYGELLALTFPDAEVSIVRDGAVSSDYRLVERDGGPRNMRIVFLEQAEAASFAVALASCIAKYARETCMAAFNRYFCDLDPGLKPTSGYNTDGHRWLADAERVVGRAGVGREILVRER